MTTLEVYDINRVKRAVLENAYGVSETVKLNAVSTLAFSLPGDDPKNSFCSPYCHVRCGEGLYRITSPAAVAGRENSRAYECEHVIATLVDDVLFGSHVVGNAGVHTADCIRYVLGHQTVARWELGECDFARQFEYGWENENLLGALMSIPNRFDQGYKWEFDTSRYPWVISLKLLDGPSTPRFYIRAGKNLLESRRGTDASPLCTRLYCLGYGEGVNQLTIREANGGSPYLESPPEHIEKYGLISRIWVDRRFTDAQSLKERGQALLREYQEPKVEYTVSAAELYDATGDKGDKARVGDKAYLAHDGFESVITEITRNHDRPGEASLTIANKSADAAGSIADLADRQRIEQLYAQGATQLYAQAVQANATPGKAATLNFYIPEGMRIVNLVTAKITLERFRSYSRSTLGGGGNETTSSSGGGGATTSGSGGGGYETTSTEGERARTSSAGGAQTSEQSVGMNDTGMTEAATREGDPHYHRFSFYLLRHTHRIGSHTHTFTTPAHGHSVSILQHSHSVSLPSHSHSVSIPQHSHAIEQGIFEYGSPTAARVTVDGRAVASIGRDAELDLTAGLVGDNGKISRGTWHKVDVVPDDMAYVTINLFTQGFIQSIGGACY